MTGVAPAAPSRAAERHRRAWLALDVVLALHVIDEAFTDFLGFYNPTVLAIRERLPWFPMPTFSFVPWLVGLMVLVVVLALLAPAVQRGEPGTRVGSWVFSGIMFLNGMGHLGGSLYYGRWLPGATTGPLLLAASVWLALRTVQRSH